MRLHLLLTGVIDIKITNEIIINITSYIIHSDSDRDSEIKTTCSNYFLSYITNHFWQFYSLKTYLGNFSYISRSPSSFSAVACSARIFFACLIICSVSSSDTS